MANAYPRLARTLRGLGLLAGMTLVMPAIGYAQGLRVEGKVQWQDPHGRLHLGRGVRVVVTDAEGRLRSVDFTDAAGMYQITMKGKPANIIVRAESWSHAAIVRADGEPTSFYGKSVNASVPPRKTAVEVNVKVASGTPLAKSLSIITALTHGRTYASARGLDLPQVDVIFPGMSSGYYGTANHSDPCTRLQSLMSASSARSVVLASLCTISIRDDDYADWDVVLHEYGHHAARSLELNGFLAGIKDHGFGTCMQKFYKKKLMQRFYLAWSEGWPTYFSSAVLNDDPVRGERWAGAGDPIYLDTRPLAADEIRFPLDTFAGRFESLGEDNEGSVARILFDLADGPNSKADGGFALGHAGVWDIFHRHKPTSLSSLWASMLHDRDMKDSISAARIFSRHRVGPTVVPPAPSRGVMMAPPRFELKWQPKSCQWTNSQYRLVFRDGDGNLIAEPYESQALDSVPAPLWEMVLRAKPPIRWMLYGSDSGEGVRVKPYLLMVGEL